MISLKGETRTLLKPYSLTLGAALSFSLLARFFILESYFISTPFMIPTLIPGDTISVEKWSFFQLPWIASKEKVRKTLNRGDIIVYESNITDGYGGKSLIRRVIGLPGDRVQLQAQQLYLNETPLTRGSHPQRAPACIFEGLDDTFQYEVCYHAPAPEDFGPVEVKEGNVFVMGDYRSREMKGYPLWQLITFQQILGRGKSIWFSVDPNPTDYGFLPNMKGERFFKEIPRKRK